MANTQLQLKTPVSHHFLDNKSQGPENGLENPQRLGSYGISTYIAFLSPHSLTCMHSGLFDAPEHTRRIFHIVFASPVYCASIIRNTRK